MVPYGGRGGNKMNFSMSEETRASLIESLKEKEKDTVRIFVKGFG